MNTKKLVLLVTVLILASLACSLPFLGGEDGSAPPTDTTGSGGDSGGPSSSSDDGQGDSSDGGDGDASSSGGDADAGNGEGPSFSPGAPLNLDDPTVYDAPITANTYKTSFDFTFNSENTVTGTVQMTGANQVDPPATTVVFHTSGSAIFGTSDVFTFTQIADTQYIVAPGFGCQSGAPGVQENPFEITLDDGGFLVGEAPYLGEEVVNGIETYVYEITMDNIDPLDPAGTDVRSIDQGRLYVAQDGGFIVRMLVDGRGVSEGLSQDPNLEGDVHYELNFFDFDVPVTIEVPAACTATGEDAIYPITDDAAEVAQFGDILTFSTGLSLADAETFYRDEMPSHGCGDPEVFSDGSTTTSMMFPGCDFGDVQIVMAVEGEATLVTILPASTP